MWTARLLARSAVTLALLGAGPPGLAQTKGDPAPGADKPVLSGPTVPPASTKPTLVERDFTGKVKRLEMAPAEAAVKAIELDDAARKQVDAILLERSVALDKIVRENIPLLSNLANAFQSGNKADQRDLLKELYEKSEPLRARGQLMEQFARVLPADKLAQMGDLVKEYWQAILQESGAGDKDAGAAPGRDPADAQKPARGAAGREAGAVRAEALAIVGRELKRSYERVVTGALKELDELIKRLALSPEQEAEVRRLTQDHFQKTAGKPTAQEKAALFLRIYDLLNKEQRAELVKALDLRRPG